MKCPACGYLSFDPAERCPRCGRAQPPRETTPRRRSRPRRRPPLPAEDLFSVGRAAAGPAPAASGRVPNSTPEGPPPRRLDAAPPARRSGDEEELVTHAEELPETTEAIGEFRIDDTLIPDTLPDTEESGRPEAPSQGGTGRSVPGAGTSHPVGPAPAQPDPVIDRDEEVPEEYWTIPAATLGRRAAALACDTIVLASLLGLYVACAWSALRAPGGGEVMLATPEGARASLLPFALLGTLLSLGYAGLTHLWGWRTPGKALLGLEVRSRDGGPPSHGRVLLRWLGGALAWTPLGLGLLWPLLDPGGRSLADRLSGTVLTHRRGGG